MNKIERNILEGIEIIDLAVSKAKRGYFYEVFRKSIRADSLNQISISVTEPGVIKAFHWHRTQQDIWHVISGKALVGLYDLRSGSKTFKKSQSIILDSIKPKLVVIPKKVAHGYKVLGSEPLVMLYLMDKEYNEKKPDEERIPFDDSEIGFDWNEK